MEARTHSDEEKTMPLVEEEGEFFMK